MPRRRAVFLIVLACLLSAAPAAASERSEARAYATAMEPLAVVTPEEGEALVAGLEARAAHVAATCFDDVKHAARRERRRELLAVVYDLHLARDALGRHVAWMRAGDERLAALPTRSKALRRGRAARRWLTGFMADMQAATTADFCAEVAAWRAKRYEGRPRTVREFMELVFADAGDGMDRGISRAAALLKRHGATRAQRMAFLGEGVWPDLRDPAPDPVAEALEAQRDDEAGRRAPF